MPRSAAASDPGDPVERALAQVLDALSAALALTRDPGAMRELSERIGATTRELEERRRSRAGVVELRGKRGAK